MARAGKVAAVLFSGGADSGLAAVRVLDQGLSIALLTVRHGPELFVGRSCRLAARLARRYGAERVRHHILDNRRLFRVALGGGLTRWEHLHYPGLLVLAERSAMHGAAAAWCLHNGIDCVVDGSTARQGAVAPPQREESVAAYRAFYGRFGLRLDCPVYDEPLSATRLAALGLLLAEDRYRADGERYDGTSLPHGIWTLIHSKLRNNLHPIYLIETGLQCLGQITDRFPPPPARRRARRQREVLYLSRSLASVEQALRAVEGPTAP